ncbi:helix-turn-helix domain-containing protein [Marinobacterium arenosum]|uniref:helix-turn-helix domain-containing protein n=1 Tax=Marinobacterium arenosum TaxID=2862496 RepID=UPI001C989D86|nr:helix-turn-helix domain-containing protein [Marinobacterium arenosum]MBY4677633.1 helix-turn-helix domain-containing protein [Marinobacterium arenosum]
MKRVAILAYDGTALFELGCAVELFALPRPEFDDWYRAEVVSFERGALGATADIQLQVTAVDSLADYQMLVVPSWPVDRQPSERLVEEIRALYARGGMVISFCSGAFLLGYSGLLDNRQATTHWRYAERFKQRFTAVDYVEDVLYVYDGRLGCAAGSSAALDLGIAVIRDQFGYQIANQVARRLVMAAHRSGGQSQFVETPLMQRPSQFAETLDWAVQNLSAGISVDQLAERANMSRRTFDRKFRASLNMTPNEWLSQQRIELAKQLLEGTELSVEQIATLAGFDNAVTLRHNFRKYLQLSPLQYRVQFGRRLA